MGVAQTLEILDIYDIYYQPFWRQKWFLIGVIVIVGICIFVIAYWLYKKQKQQQSILSVSQVTLGLLQQLKEQKKREPEKFYSQLTRIIKWYIHEQYQLSVMSSTDDEFLQLLHQTTQVPQETVKVIQHIFDGVTVIKFAGQDVVEQEMEKALSSMIQLITTQLHI